MRKHAKLIYAQSSDIKARRFLEYRKDMKKKAIAELEMINWLKIRLKKEMQKEDITVEKYGGDKFLWFLRGGGITRDPDFVVKDSQGNVIFYVEFQYTDREDLQYFDFKVSKVGKKVKGKRIPYKDRIFLYIFKNSLKYTFINPCWIIRHGKLGVVPAWGSRPAYRVPKEKFEKKLKEDKDLKEVIETIDAKTYILEFQHKVTKLWQNELSNELQKVVDEDKIVKINPKTLKDFFKVCFLLDHLNKIPENLNLWLIYLLSYININLDLREIAMFTYSLDFLYSKISIFNNNELRELEDKLISILDRINDYYDRNTYFYKSSPKNSPCEETRFALFSINLIEDIIQDAIYYHNANLSPIRGIYQNVRYPLKVANMIKNECN